MTIRSNIPPGSDSTASDQPSPHYATLRLVAHWRTLHHAIEALAETNPAGARAVRNAILVDLGRAMEGGA